MKPTSTGIAVGLALVVVIVFFIFPGLSPFGQPAVSAPVAADQSLATSSESMSSTTPSVTELQSTDETVGAGATAEPGDTVTVNYVGSFTNGTVFDASANHGSTGFTFTLGGGQVIAGWDQGIVGMKVGGKRKLVVPASLGYGSQDYGPIPGNSTLVFEVELLSVQKGQ
jgi:FKBP-type peptidyl-prolyl cis-trans isomerase